VQSFWSLAPQFDEPIIDSSMVDQPTVGKENCRGRYHIDFGELNEFMLRIAEFWRR
jgi:hypothetical protein